MLTASSALHFDNLGELWRLTTRLACALFLFVVSIEAKQELNIEEFAKRLPFEGTSYEKASKYNASHVPILLVMLAKSNPSFQVVATLGAIGDPRAVRPLIALLEQGEQKDVLSLRSYKVKTAILISLGWLANKGSDKNALDYLIKGLEPAVWSKRLQWRSPRHGTVEKRNKHLVALSIIGLALSGHPAAKPHLEGLRDLHGPQVPDPQLLDEALKIHKYVLEHDLADYYRNDGQIQ